MRGSKMMYSPKSIFQKSFFLLNSSLIGKVFYSLYTLFLARHLEVNVLGSFFISLSVNILFQSMSNLGLTTGILKFIAADQEDESKLYGLAHLVPLLSFSMLYLVACSGLFEYIIHRLYVDQLVYSGIVLLTFSCLFDNIVYNLSSLAMGAGNIRFTFVFQNIGMIAFRATATFVLYYSHAFDPWRAVIFGYTVGSFVNAVTCSAYFYWLKKPKLEFDFAYGYSLIKYSLPLSLSYCLCVAQRRIDVLILGIFVNIGSVAIYEMVIRVIYVLDSLFQFVRPMAEPYIASIVDIDKKKLAYNLHVIMKCNLLLVLPIVGAFFLYPDHVLGIFGSKYNSGAMILQMLLAINLISMFSGLEDSILMMSGNSLASFRSNLVSLIAGVILNLTFVPVFGIIGAAISCLVTFVLTLTIRHLQVRRLTGVDIFSTSYIRPVICSLLSTGIFFLLVPAADSMLKLIAFVLLYAIFYVTTYCVSAMIFDGDKSDIALFKDIFFKNAT